MTVPIHNFTLADDNSWLRCGECGKTSYNLNDVKMRYCGHCHTFLSQGNCDFCCQRGDTFRDYAAANQFHGITDDGRVVTDGDLLWAACPACERLIEAGEWETLVRQAMDYVRKHGGIRTNTRVIIAEMYRSVFGDKFTLRHES